MRLLLISGSYPMEKTGGAEIQTLLIARGLSTCGYDATYLAANTDEEGQTKIDNVNVIKIPGMEMVGRVQHKRYLEKAILESCPDLCYVRSFSQLMWVTPVCKKNRIPVISISCHGSEVSPFPIKLSLRELISSLKRADLIWHFLNFRSIRLSDMHICLTGELQKGIKRWYPNKPGRVIYNGHPVPPQEDVHKEYSRRIVWINNIKRFKRPEIYIELASLLPDIEFVMIGRLDRKGKYNGYVRSLIEHGPKNLTYLGALPFDLVNAEISKSDILVYTSTTLEGFGNSLVQAWMRGVPTISLNYDPDGIIERERIGHCASNFSQLVKHTRELIDSPLTLNEMGQRARKYAESNHDCEYMVSQYDALFRDLISQKMK